MLQGLGVPLQVIQGQAGEQVALGGVDGAVMSVEDGAGTIVALQGRGVPPPLVQGTADDDVAPRTLVATVGPALLVPHVRERSLRLLIALPRLLILAGFKGGIANIAVTACHVGGLPALY